MLAQFLADAFVRQGRASWNFVREGRLFDDRVAERLDFDPRVDLLLERGDGFRVAVELEISRADPVANQVKFLLAREQRALRPEDVIVSMVSSHVAPGRRAIAAAFTRHMRAQGMSAFQSSLLPFTSPHDVRTMNQATPGELSARRLPIRDELARVFDIIEPRGDADRHRIHFAGDVTDVIANLWSFNDTLESHGLRAWKRRRVQFFVVDPATGLFAPSKFCAFVPAPRDGRTPGPPTMTFDIYAALGERDPRFDGNIARRHLARRLAFETTPLDESTFASTFARWHVGARADALELRSPVTLLVPPRWHWHRRSP